MVRWGGGIKGGERDHQERGDFSRGQWEKNETPPKSKKKE
jgi:hypothetical protein